MKPTASARAPNATEYEAAVAMAPTASAPSPVPASKLRFHAMLTDPDQNLIEVSTYL